MSRGCDLPETIIPISLHYLIQSAGSGSDPTVRCKRISMKIETILEKGSSSLNQDNLVVESDLFGVFDRATSLDNALEWVQNGDAQILLIYHDNTHEVLVDREDHEQFNQFRTRHPPDFLTVLLQQCAQEISAGLWIALFFWQPA